MFYLTWISYALGIAGFVAPGRNKLYIYKQID